MSSMWSRHASVRSMCQPGGMIYPNPFRIRFLGEVMQLGLHTHSLERTAPRDRGTLSYTFILMFVLIGPRMNIANLQNVFMGCISRSDTEQRHSMPSMFSVRTVTACVRLSLTWACNSLPRERHTGSEAQRGVSVLPFPPTSWISLENYD